MREDIPKDEVRPDVQCTQRVEFLFTGLPEWIEMKPIHALLKKTVTEAKKLPMRIAMVNQEENEILTRVSPGSPCGELRRCYSHPIAAGIELTEASHGRPNEGMRWVEMLEKKVI
jgi:hypothetical protein